MLFNYTTVNARGKRQTAMLEAADLASAQRDLMARGLYVLELEPGKPDKSEVRPAGDLGLTDRRAPSGAGRVAPAAKPAELLLFVRQMAMMLRAGASVVPAIQAVREQPGRPGWHALLDDLAENVQGGANLRDALAGHPRYFSGVFLSIVGAGEATGTLADSFLRLGSVLETRRRLRRRVVAALTYPCVLLLLATGVVVAMTLFVLPRFADLFAMLDAELPAITRLLLAASGQLKTRWPRGFGLPLGAVIGAGARARTPGGRRLLGRVALRVPLLGHAVAGAILSHLLLVWAALLRSHVSVLEAIRQTRELSSNAVFQDLIARVEQAVTEGRSISGVLKQSSVVPPPVVSAIAIGEESGRLGESMEFVGSWTEEENDSRIAALTRVLEPAILILMGLVVGTVCVAMFLPLFEIATAAG